MDSYDLVISIIDSNDGEIKGRTAIQKLVFLSNCVYPEIKIPTYKPHYYGPFSSELGTILEKLVSYSFISENKIPGKMYEGYSYNLTQDGQNAIEEIKNKDNENYEKINKLVKTCKEFCGLKIASLSYASKIFYMLETEPNEKQKLSKNGAIENARKLGWKVSKANFDEGAELLERLELVKIS